MTVPEIIAQTLDKIRRDFYTVDGQIRTREFMRDYRPLMKAIATYGYECNQRGWNFEPEFIYQELKELLKEIRTAEADIQYLPVYLAGAVRSHLGQRAEELSAKAKATNNIVKSLQSQISNLKSVPETRQPTTVEVFAEVYRGIKQINRANRAARASKRPQTTQKELL